MVFLVEILPDAFCGCADMPNAMPAFAAFLVLGRVPARTSGLAATGNRDYRWAVGVTRLVAGRERGR